MATYILDTPLTARTITRPSAPAYERGIPGDIATDIFHDAVVPQYRPSLGDIPTPVDVATRGWWRPQTRWTTKPPPGTQLDATHPLCPDYCWPFLSPQGTATPLCRNRALLPPSPLSDMYAGTKSWVGGGKYGLSIRHASQATNVDRTNLATDAGDVNQIVNTGSAGYTLLLAFRPTTVVGNHTMAVDTGTASQDMFILLPWTDGFYYFEYGGTQAKVSTAGITQGDDLWFGTAGPRGVELWQNRTLIASNAAVPSRSASIATNNLTINGWTQPNGPLGDFAFVMTWRRQLSGAEITQLANNPWQVFQPKPMVAEEFVGSINAGDLWFPPPRRWNRKPVPGTQLDTTHKYCPDHCWPILSPEGALQCLTRRLKPPTPSTGVYSGSQTVVPSARWGLAVRHGATGDRWVLADSTTDADEIVGLDGNFTLFIASKKTDTTNRNSTIFGVDTNTVGNRCQMHCPFNDGNIYFDYGSTRVQVTTGVTYGDDLWCFNAGPRGSEIWQNGVLLAQNVAAASRGSGGGGATGTLGGPANPSFADLNDTGFIMTWRRQLPTDAIRDLYVNPWQVFQPRRVALFSGPDPLPIPPIPPGGRFPALFLAP